MDYPDHLIPTHDVPQLEWDIYRHYGRFVAACESVARKFAKTVPESFDDLRSEAILGAYQRLMDNATGDETPMDGETLGRWTHQAAEQHLIDHYRSMEVKQLRATDFYEDFSKPDEEDQIAFEPTTTLYRWCDDALYEQWKKDLLRDIRAVSSRLGWPATILVEAALEEEQHWINLSKIQRKTGISPAVTRMEFAAMRKPLKDYREDEFYRDPPPNR